MKDWVRRMHAVVVKTGIAPGPGPWMPAADVYRTSGGWLVKFELAGVRPEDLVVRVEGRSLSLAGTRRDWCVQEGQSFHSMEISYSRFQRRIEFPCELAGSKIEMEYREGMLLVRLHCEAEPYGGAR